VAFDDSGSRVRLEVNVALVRRYYEEVLSGRDDSLLGELLDPGFLSHGPGGVTVGVDGYAKAVAATHAAFADLTVSIHDQIAEGDEVVTRWSATGTQTGPYVGVPPSNRVVTVSGIHIHRVHGGRLVEHWEEVDALGALRQMGAFG
jgi:steroid delta-isomerase-like uncharacterized protein